MTRRFALTALWVAATVVAILMASFAVRLVGDSVVAEGPATVTRGEVEADLSQIPATTAVDVPLPEPAPQESSPSSESATPTSTAVVGVTPLPSPVPTAPATTRVPDRVDPPMGAAGDAPVSTTATAPPPAVTAPPPVEQSFPLVGGSVRVRCVGATASLVASSPNPGYDMEVRTNGPERVEVRFTATSHTSELKAWCSGGSISAEPKESGQGDDRD